MSNRKVGGKMMKMEIDTTPIESDPQAFIQRAKLEYRTVEGNYRTTKWKLVQKCAVTVAYFRKHGSFREYIRNSEFWADSREKPNHKRSAKWCTFFILDPKSAQERATAGRYAAVVEFLLTSGIAALNVAAELKGRGGIDKVYAASTGRTERISAEDDVTRSGSSRDYDKDDLHIKWTEDQRDELLSGNGKRQLTVLVTGNSPEFKPVTIKSIQNL